MLAPHVATLARSHGVSLDVLASRGGISVFELLLLQPVPAGTNRTANQQGILDLSVTGAMLALSRLLTQWHKQKEADAEAAMLALMEAEAAEPAA